jgi:hypothetical protein
MARKEKIQVYVPQDVDFDELINKVAALRKTEGKQYRPFGKMEHTVSEVIIDALQELAAEWDDGKKSVKKT